MEHVQKLEPSKHKRLVEFVCGLQKRTATDPSTGEPLRAQGDILWTDLPSFGYTEYKTWDSCGGGYTDPWSLNLQGEPRQRWMNKNAFAAKFTQATNISYDPPPDQGPSIHRLDRSLRAIMTSKTTKSPWRRCARRLPWRLRVWLMYAADRLWDNVRYGRTYSRNLVMGPGCKRFKKRKWKGCERGRWDAWVERLRGATAVCDDERMRGVIGEALGCVERPMRR